MTMSTDRGRRRMQAVLPIILAAALAVSLPNDLGAETDIAKPDPRPQSRPAMVEAVRPPDARPPEQALDKSAIRGGPSETCRARLRTLGVKFSAATPISVNAGCRVPAPVAITEISPGVRLTPDSRLNCQTAEALATWVRDVVLPASTTELGLLPTALVHDSTYVCRRRNGRPDGKLSEHAIGNAIDIKSIAFAGRNAFPIKRRNGRASAEKRFQTRLRKGACEYFSTVLGPGTNAAHATHFHFDLARRKGGYRLCE